MSVTNTTSRSFESLLYRARAAQPLWFRLLTDLPSRVYSLLVSTRNALYDKSLLRARRLPGTTISIGNLAIGGTGKTPVILSLAASLASRGQRVAILTRGYGASWPTSGCIAIRGNQPLWRHNLPFDVRLPDESALMAARLPDIPIIIGAARYEAALQHLAFTPPDQHPEVWILDDGFQHRHLHRDQDIVLLDATQPLGNGHLLPAGPLRERPDSLARAHSILLTRAEETAPAATLATLAPFTSAPVVPITFTTGSPTSIRDHHPLPLATPCAVVSAIARPERFTEALSHLGYTITDTIYRPDHTMFQHGDLTRISRDTPLVITEKDFHRDPRFWETLNRAVFVAPLSVPATFSGISLSFRSGVPR
jgi:tetraacyldisaccharide 4'-kinase